MATKCPKCNTDIPADSKYCKECATPLPSSKEIPASPTKTLETPTQELTRGSTFAGRYEIIEELGKGGMGKVYRVEDKKIKEEVALKLIKPEIASDKKTIERFSNELKMARKIAHRNVCKMYDLGEEKGTHYITMEYVPGEDLKSLIRKICQLPIAKAVSLAMQVCEGLDEAHGLGIVHRDLKPQNIMIDEAGNVRIMDFGIARSLKTQGITETGTMIGTPEYMSPEQVESKEADQRSDIYSLGVILYEMVAGRVPFEGETTLSIALKHKKETPQNPRELNSQVPEDLGQLILRCMEKDKERRYQGAMELFSELGKTAKETLETKKPNEMEWKNSIAVLPFADLSPEKDQEYFCDGLSEEIINALTKIKGLRIVARTSAFSFKGEKIDVREIGKKLNVETVLEGSVRKADARLRITAQLINVADGYHLWSEKYDRDMEDIFAIQDEVTLAIVDKLKVELMVGEKVELTKRHTVDLDAYNLYLKGSHFMRQMTKESLQKSLKFFEQATEKDPNYAMAYVGIASYYNNLGFYNFVSPKMSFLKAVKYIKKALEIDNNLAAAHTVFAFSKTLYEWDWDGAEKEFKQSIELNPNRASTHTLFAHYLWVMGRFDEAVAEGKLAQELNPLSCGAVTTMGTIFMTARQYDRSIEEYEKALEIDPNYFDAHLWLAFPYFLKGMIDEAVATIEKAMVISGGGPPFLRALLAYIYASSGKKSEAKKILSKMQEQSKKTYIANWMLATIHAGLGQKDKAFELLEASFKEHEHWLIYLKVSPVVDNLRSDPRFKKLLKKMRFE